MHTFQRHTQKKVTTALADTPVVFVMGARQSGKTTLAKSLMDASWTYIDLDDQNALSSAKQDPMGLIRNMQADHVVIDEIQRVPQLLLAIKQSVDLDRRPGRFLLTGSANALVLPQVLDSLAGRIETIRMDTLSECEIHDTPPTFLANLLKGQLPKDIPHFGRPQLIQRIVTGCFPEPVQRPSEERAHAWYQQYLQTLIQKDMREIEHIDQPEKLLKLLKLLAHYSGKLTQWTDLGHKLTLDRTTVKKYTGMLEQMFLLQPLPAWHANAYKRLVKTPKLHLKDTGLICAIQEMGHDYLAQHPDVLGPLVETFVINELQKQAEWLPQNLQFYHYRDKDQVEVDCIMEQANGDCIGIEIKASTTLTQKDFTGLRRLQETLSDAFKIGVLLYDGDRIMPFGDQLFAVPIAGLWR